MLVCCSFIAAQSPPPAHAALAHRILVPIVARDAAFGDFWSDTERQTVAEINRRRQANGCRAATLNRELSVAAKRHSKDMASKNFLSHTGSDGSSPFQRIQQAGYRYSKAGEIIAAGYTTPESVVQGWMNSPGHKAIMLDCDYQDIGIGLEFNRNTSWRYFWTVTFGQRR
jgi:uncharacterized protein YkwD